ncbi:MAG: hypothetical protein HOC23_04425 [Halieaceae bacterium]|nr:hypothetical protein [Halieaceae bacterium]
MKDRPEVLDTDSISEIAVVDTFTKLIFGEEVDYNEREMQIIQALRRVDDNVALNDHRSMGTYLRTMGVAELIKLVPRVRRSCLKNVYPAILRGGERSSHRLGIL